MTSVIAESRIQVHHVPTASFEDLQEIGMEELSGRDVTIVHRLILPGYTEFLTRVAEKAKNLTLGACAFTAEEIQKEESYQALVDGYQALTGLEGSKANLALDNGKLVKGKTAAHFDYGSDDAGKDTAPRVTFNTTFYTAEQKFWFWRLGHAINDYTQDADAETLSRLTYMPIPLIPGGTVILGDNARKLSSGKFCTALHEVAAPPKAAEATTVQRIRLLQFFD